MFEAECNRILSNDSLSSRSMSSHKNTSSLLQSINSSFLEKIKIKRINNSPVFFRKQQIKIVHGHIVYLSKLYIFFYFFFFLLSGDLFSQKIRMAQFGGLGLDLRNLFLENYSRRGFYQLGNIFFITFLVFIF